MSRRMKSKSDKEFYLSLGARIRIAREILGWTQGKLGKAVGLTRTSIINIEQGRQSVPLHTFVMLASNLRCSFKLLLIGSSERGKQ